MRAGRCGLNGSRPKQTSLKSVGTGVCLHCTWLQSDGISLQAHHGVGSITQDKLRGKQVLTKPTGGVFSLYINVSS